MVTVRIVVQVGLSVVLAGCGAVADEPAGPSQDPTSEARGLAVQACGMVSSQVLVDDSGAEEMRELAHVYGDAVDPLVRAVVRDPQNGDYADLMGAVGMAEAGWESAAELVETHGEDAAAWDAESTGDYDRLVTRLLGYEDTIETVCQGLS